MEFVLEFVLEPRFEVVGYLPSALTVVALLESVERLSTALTAANGPGEAIEGNLLS